MLLFQENMNSSFSSNVGQDKATFHFRTRILQSAMPFKTMELGAQLPLPAQVRCPFFTWRVPFISVHLCQGLAASSSEEYRSLAGPIRFILLLSWNPPAPTLHSLAWLHPESKFSPLIYQASTFEALSSLG